MATLVSIRVCRRCLTEKQSECFRQRQDGTYRNQCRSCEASYTADWRRKNPEAFAEQRLIFNRPPKSRDYLYRYRYGISLSDVEEMEKRQEGRCAICSKETKLHVDHDADTGRVRGLLCGSCNRGIGLLRHDADVLRQAVSYLAEGDNGDVG